MHTYWTSMLWSIDSCQNRVSADQYHLTVSRAQVSTHRGQVFFWSYPLTRYWFSNDRRLKFNFFLNSYEICCVYVPHNWNFGFKLTSDAKIQAAATGREDSCFWLFSPCSRVGDALRPIFMLWLVTIWQLSSCGRFMQHLESCLLWQLSQLVMFFTCLFPLDVQNEIQLLSGMFCYSWVVCLCHLSKSEIRFRMALFSFFALLDA